MTVAAASTGPDLLRELDESGITRAHWKIMFMLPETKGLSLEELNEEAPGAAGHGRVQPA